MKILEVAGSGTIGTNDMGPVSNVIFQLSNQFCELGHDVTIADAKTTAHREHYCLYSALNRILLIKFGISFWHHINHGLMNINL